MRFGWQRKMVFKAFLYTESHQIPIFNLDVQIPRDSDPESFYKVSLAFTSDSLVSASNYPIINSNLSTNLALQLSQSYDCRISVLLQTVPREWSDRRMHQRLSWAVSSLVFLSETFKANFKIIFPNIFTTSLDMLSRIFQLNISKTTPKSGILEMPPPFFQGYQHSSNYSDSWCCLYFPLLYFPGSILCFGSSLRYFFFFLVPIWKSPTSFPIQ